MNTVYKHYVSHLVVARYLLMPHIRHVYVLLPLIRPHIRHLYLLQPLVMPHIRLVHLGLHIAVILKGRTSQIWSFGCGFACATAMGCAGFGLLYGTIIVL